VKDFREFNDRIGKLRSAHEEAKSETLRDLYTCAIGLTEEASWRLLSLFESAEAKGMEDARIAAARHELAMDQLKGYKRELADIKASLATPVPDAIRASLAVRLKFIQAVLRHDPFHLLAEMLDQQAAERMKQVDTLVEQLTNKILAPEPGEFVLNTAVEGINFAIGLIPIAGSIYSALLAAYNIGTDQSKKKKHADSVLSYLEEYCIAVKVWIAAAESAIRAHALLDDP
jgi:hypothetical protein